MKVEKFNDEMVALEFRRFRIPEGKPTCAVDFKNDKVCQFLGTKCFGTKEVCLVTQNRIYRENGFLQPSKGCIIWNEGKDAYKNRVINQF